LKNPISCAKSANAVKNRDWERGVFPRACTCFLRPPGFFNTPIGISWRSAAHAAIMSLMQIETEHSHEDKRHWVRITRACNNRCLFCLDRDSLDGEILDRETIMKDLLAGIARNARRVVISGGEPTIHPEFTQIVAQASAMGYAWVQTISNGRMFCYRNFLDCAVEAGLREITFSMHGHTRELFERLTGAPDSFRQALGGLRNALEKQGLVVSVDIIISALNCDLLHEIVQFYHELGVGEFDLLYPVPFGAAWSRRGEVLIDTDRAAPALRKTLEYGIAHGLRIWTNRVPPALLEGFESHIQTPSRIYDEVHERRDMFLDFLHGTSPGCRNDRCHWCHMADYCGFLEQARQERDGKGAGLFALTPETLNLLESAEPSLIRGVAASPADTIMRPEARNLAKIPNLAVYLSFNRIPQIREIPDLPGAHAVIDINRDTAPELIQKGLPDLGNIPVSLHAPGYKNLSSCCEKASSLVDFFAEFSGPGGAPFPVVFNTPPCMSGVAYRALLPMLLLAACPNIEWDLDELTQFFITNRYHKHSSRCRDCAEFGACPGLHINYARHFGFAQARPLCAPVKSYS